MTDAEYNCIDVIVTARCASIMASHNPSCAIDTAMIGPALTMGIDGIPIRRNRIAAVRKQITEKAKAIQAEFPPEARFPSISLRPSTASLAALLSSMGTKSRLSKNDAPSLTAAILDGILRDPRTSPEAASLIEKVLHLAALENDRRALDSLPNDKIIHPVFLLGEDWGASGAWSPIPDFSTPPLSDLIDAEIQIINVNADDAVWHKFVGEKPKTVIAEFPGKRKKDGPRKLGELPPSLMLTMPTPAFFARRFGITREQASTCIADFGEANPRMTEFHEGMVESVRKGGILTNPLGRTRRLMGRTWDDAYARECLNWTIETTRLDIAHLVLYDLWKKNNRIFFHRSTRIVAIPPKSVPRCHFAGTPIKLET